MPRNEDVDVLELRIEIAARPETIFPFLSDPLAFQRWMGAGSSLGRGPGAGFRVVYPNGHVAAGVVEELVPNRRVVLSWGYENGVNDMPVGSTRVEITLSPRPGGTLVILRHSGLETAEQRWSHRAGWRHYLASLSQFASAGLDAVVERVLAAYIGAWSEPDPSTRRKRLEECWDPQGIFRDTMGYAEGLDDLADYIGIAQRFAPGLTMERDGAVSRSHGFLSHRWRLVGPDGSQVMTGSNTVELTGDGLIRSVTGFWDQPGA